MIPTWCGGLRSKDLPMNAGPPWHVARSRPIVRESRVPDPHILPRARTWFRRSVLPSYAFLLVTVALFGAGRLPWPRLALMVVAFTVLALLQWTVIRTARRPAGVQARALWVSARRRCRPGRHAGPDRRIASPIVPSSAPPSPAPSFSCAAGCAQVVVWGAAVVVLAVVALAPSAWTTVPALPPLLRAALQMVALAWACYGSPRAVDAERSAARDAVLPRGHAGGAGGGGKDQLRRLQSVGAKVAHELKNPLASIKGLMQLVERANADPKTGERLAVVTTEIARMETILRDYLSYSRPLEDLHLEEVELSALVADVRAVLSGRAEHARVGVECRGEPLRIQGDARRLKEALINIVANAIEATPAGGTVDVAVERAPDHARVVIKDSGAACRPSS